MGTLKKILTTGVGAALMTESGIRSAISEIQLTRQAKEYLARQAQKGKEEVVKILARELKKSLNHIDIHREIQKALDGLTLTVAFSYRPKAKRGK
jgi:hypothetical protein